MKRRKVTRRMVRIVLPETVPFSDVECGWTTHVLICRQCGARRYTDSRLALFFEEAGKILEEDSSSSLWPRHKPCDSIMKLEALGRDDDVLVTRMGKGE